MEKAGIITIRRRTRDRNPEMEELRRQINEINARKLIRATRHNLPDGYIPLSEQLDRRLYHTYLRHT